MSLNINYSNLSEVPTKLPEKLKQIRDRTGLTPDEFAPHVNATNGREISKYESGKGDVPVRVLMGYWKLSNVPLENLMNDDRDLWLGHRVN